MRKMHAEIEPVSSRTKPRPSSSAVRRVRTESPRALHAERTRLGVAGHDLRNPLQAIQLAAGVLESSPEQSSEKVRRYAQRILSSASRMSEMIRQLLDFAHAQGEEALTAERAEIDLASVCRDVIDEFSLAHPGRVDFLVRGDSRGDFDAGRIAQLVSNLVGNALVHGSAQQRVRVRIEGNRADQVILIVSNRGATIAPAVLPDIFEPFRKGRSRSGGLGLGLFIVRETARAHRGTVSVRSHDGLTEFRVTLPRR